MGYQEVSKLGSHFAHCRTVLAILKFALLSPYASQDLGMLRFARGSV